MVQCLDYSFNEIIRINNNNIEQSNESKLEIQNRYNNVNKLNSYSFQ
jgi:hypothetical protein